LITRWDAKLCTIDEGCSAVKKDSQICAKLHGVMSQNTVIFIARWEPPTSRLTSGVTRSQEGFALVDILRWILGILKKVSNKRCVHQGPNEYPCDSRSSYTLFSLPPSGTTAGFMKKTFDVARNFDAAWTLQDWL